MIIKLNLQSDTPIYEQLCTAIIEAIATNNLESGETLPTVRQLSADLGINMHTVSKSYNILKHKGFLSINRSKGAVINDKSCFLANDINVINIQSEIRPAIAECIARGMSNEDIVALISETANNIKEITDGT